MICFKMHIFSDKKVQFITTLRVIVPIIVLWNVFNKHINLFDLVGHVVSARGTKHPPPTFSQYTVIFSHDTRRVKSGSYLSFV
jgi:hypothetical protein